MSNVMRLETLVGLRDDDSDAGRMSLSARLEAVLVDGSRVVLLNGRGWVEKLTGGKPGDTPLIWKLTRGETRRLYAVLSCRSMSKGRG